MPPLKIVHTSDWHLGHKLHGVDRTQEHRAFLVWLMDMLEKEKPQALLISGDIFDTSNPPYAAQTLWFNFLTECKRAHPSLNVIAVAGNHDSAGGLEAPGKLLDAIGVKVIGTVRFDGSEMNLEELVVPIVDGDAGVVAAVLAIPFLRAPELWRLAKGEGEGVAIRRLVDATVSKIEETYGEIPLVAMGHLYVSGSKISDLSERRVVRGNQEAVTADRFSEDFDYAALGHLHLAQRVGSDNVQYSGSPIPLSMDERRYRHRVNLVTFDGRGGVLCEPCYVPRFREIVRIPEAGSLEKAEALATIGELSFEPDQEPLLEVCVELSGPEPTLRREVENALEGKSVRLVRLSAVFKGSGRDVVDEFGDQDITSVDPARVFEVAFQREYGGAPAEKLKEAFEELLVEVSRAES